MPPTIFVHRSQWLARYPRHEPEKLHEGAQRGLAVHHSGSGHEQRQHHEDCATTVRAIQSFHMDGRGWSDIAYNWLSCIHGYLFEGRGLGVRSAAQGTPEGNGSWHAVCFLGDGTTFPQLDQNATMPLLSARGLVLSHYATAVDVWPHLRFHATACPGKQLRDWCRQFPDVTKGPTG